MQFFPTKLPIIVLRRVEEQIPAVREIVVSAVCVCVCARARADKRIISAYFEDLCGTKYKMFSRNLILSFSVVSDFKDDFLCLGWNVHHSVSSISVITYSMLLMIGHVREKRHMY